MFKGWTLAQRALSGYKAPMSAPHFTLVKINPPDAAPSHGFDDVMLPLYYALRSLGYRVEILFNKANPLSRNIVFGSCISPRRTGRILPAGSIIFNLEQINFASKWCGEDYLAHLRAFEVWDYSAANARALTGLGIRALHVPLGYVPEMTRLRPDFPLENEALFYGLITERRDKLLRALAATGIGLLATQEAFGALRDVLLARSRLVLNIHQFLPARLETARLGYVWANKKPVLSERRADTEVPDYLEESCVFASYEETPELLASLLRDAPRLRRQAELGFAAFASRPLSACLEKLLGRRASALPSGLKTEERPYYIKAAPEWLIRAPA